MKNARKILSLLLIVMLIFGICSCSKEVKHLEPREDLFESITLGMSETEFQKTKSSLQSVMECPTKDVYKTIYYETLVDDETVEIDNVYQFDPEGNLVGISGYYKLKKGNKSLSEDKITESIELTKEKFTEKLDGMYSVSDCEAEVVPHIDGAKLQEYFNEISCVYGIEQNEINVLITCKPAVSQKWDMGEYTVSLFGGSYKESSPEEIYFFVSVVEDEFAKIYYDATCSTYN
ncbi:MAG: hypothetical protein E7218_06560 [Anaerofustis stercorihominis]|nr:hypothetical protein [Anaerofustis stercorihominis]